MKKVSVTQAIGKVLAHDLSRFAEGVKERTPFRKGHIIQADDIPLLLAMGKENLFIMEEGDGGISGKVHEEDAARRLAALCMNAGIKQGAVREGKIELFAESDGLFHIDLERLNRINSVPNIVIAARRSLSTVKAGDKLAGVKVVPLEVAEDTMRQAEAAAGKMPLFELLPYRLKTAAAVITGSEVAAGRIHDAFEPLLKEKLALFGIELVKTVFSDDGIENIIQAITQVRCEKPDMVICTGGMSVDPDDNTPGAIRQSGAAIVTYGAPILPGSMFLLGYFDDGVPVMGIPGGALYKRGSGGVIDIVLPRLTAGLPMTREDFVRLGNGGLCLSCPQCHYPVCPYGKA